jgi:hypothetical protein
VKKPQSRKRKAPRASPPPKVLPPPEASGAGEMPAVPELICYRVSAEALEIIPGRAPRTWMDETNERFAYRCIPLSIANASGWELILPFSFSAVWNGGPRMEDITIFQDEPSDLVMSHFGHGVLTFHTGWLFKTSPGWALWCRGAPNHLHDGIVPLEGLVETDWLPFPFTMNWRFVQPGAVRFEKGESVCFVTPTPHAILDDVAPSIRSIDEDPALKTAYQNWGASRADFNARLAQREPAAVAEKWQRTYVQGTGKNGESSPFHRTKRKLQTPR